MSIATPHEMLVPTVSKVTLFPHISVPDNAPNPVVKPPSEVGQQGQPNSRMPSLQKQLARSFTYGVLAPDLYVPFGFHPL